MEKRGKRVFLCVFVGFLIFVCFCGFLIFVFFLIFLSDVPGVWYVVI